MKISSCTFMHGKKGASLSRLPLKREVFDYLIVKVGSKGMFFTSPLGKKFPCLHSIRPELSREWKEHLKQTEGDEQLR